VKDDTKRRLDLIGGKGDSYDDIIRRLLKNHPSDDKPTKPHNLSLVEER